MFLLSIYNIEVYIQLLVFKSHWKGDVTLWFDLVLAMGNQSLLGFLNTGCWCYLSELGGVNHTCIGTSVELTKQGAIAHFQEFTPFVLFTWVLVVVDPVYF